MVSILEQAIRLQGSAFFGVIFACFSETQISTCFDLRIPKTKRCSHALSNRALFQLSQAPGLSNIRKEGNSARNRAEYILRSREYSEIDAETIETIDRCGSSADGKNANE